MVYNRQQKLMKRIMFFLMTLTMGISAISAQTAPPTLNDCQSNTQIAVAEYVEPDSNNISYLESLIDASFPTEQHWQDYVTLTKKEPNQLAASLLAILLGNIGIHHFYTGQTVRGVIDILFCWTGVPAVIGLIEGIVWLCDDEAEWAERVAEWNSK